VNDHDTYYLTCNYATTFSNSVHCMLYTKCLLQIRTVTDKRNFPLRHCAYLCQILANFKKIFTGKCGHRTITDLRTPRNVALMILIPQSINSYHVPGEGWKDELTLVVGYVPRWFTCPQTVTQN